MVAAQISRLAAVGVVRIVTSKNLGADVSIRNISLAKYVLKLTHRIIFSFRNFRTLELNQGGKDVGGPLCVYIKEDVK